MVTRPERGHEGRQTAADRLPVVNDVVSIPLPDGTRHVWRQRYQRTVPRGMGLEATVDVRELAPTQDSTGRWWANWEAVGPTRYWQDGREITEAAFDAACRALPCPTCGRGGDDG